MNIFRKIAVLCMSALVGLVSCRKEVYKQAYNEFPVYPDERLWTDYTPQRTEFKLWSPVASEVVVNLYSKGDGGKLLEKINLRENQKGLWQVAVASDLKGVYYTYQLKINGKWLEETPGIYAQAVGVNGKRAMVIDLASTNPAGWEQDKGPVVKSPNDIILYELHVRDITQHANSGSTHRGKYLGLVEGGTKNAEGLATGIDHMLELGITHVHLLPAFDHKSIDETKLEVPQFNWGYDPLNYNVPEGSFSSDPYKAEVRIKEFKQMVKGFHDRGLGVILDVVYNHTGLTENSYFNLEVPGYYYRHTKHGQWSNASACGNETASERTMMRKYIIESCKYWAQEYHLDGFRFDLMGIHDIETMNLLSQELKKINPNIVVYGEGWTAGESPLPDSSKALKANTYKLHTVAAFSDDIRDGLKGSVFEEKDKGFVSGAKGMEESVKFGIIGSIQHPQVDYSKVNYSKAPWAREPWQAVSYVSCHDNQTLYDKLKVSCEEATEPEIQQMHKLANAVVLTSQGIPFLHAGVEILRTKQGEHNSFDKPDTINQIDWSWKTANQEIMTYYQGLIALRKAHPAFRMPTTEMVNKHLDFITVEPGLIGYLLKDNANQDRWKNIAVYYNARKKPAKLSMKGEWQVAVMGNTFDQEGRKKIKDRVDVPALSMLVLFQAEGAKASNQP